RTASPGLPEARPPRWTAWAREADGKAGPRPVPEVWHKLGRPARAPPLAANRARDRVSQARGVFSKRSREGQRGSGRPGDGMLARLWPRRGDALAAKAGRAAEASRRSHAIGAKPGRAVRVVLPLIGIFVVGTGARLLVLQQLGGLPLFRTPQLDSLEYRLRAERILAGDRVGPSPRPHAPGYAYFAAGVFRGFGDSVAALGV